MRRFPFHIFAASCAIVFLAVPVAAQSTRGDTLPTVDPRVEAVVSGGSWVQGTRRGRYRIIVATEGWEAIRRRAFVQWIEEGGGAGEPERVHAVRDLTSMTDFFALAEPVLQLQGAHWTVTLQGAAQPMGEYAYPVRFILGVPDSVRVVTAR